MAIGKSSVSRWNSWRPALEQKGGKRRSRGKSESDERDKVYACIILKLEVNPQIYKFLRTFQ
jgi:hypothetical protein